MRILIATPLLPWPWSEGGRVAQFRTLEALKESCSFTLVVPIYGTEQEREAKVFEKLLPHVAVEPVQCFHPAQPSSRRALMRRKAKTLLGRVFPAEAPSPLQMGRETVPEVQFHSVHPAFVEAVERQFEKGCDIFQAEFANMLCFGPFMAGRVPSIFVHHQLHFVYARRFLEANGSNGAAARYYTEKMIREEAAYLSAYDSVIVFSEVDRRALVASCPNLDVNVSPFPTPEEPLAAARKFTGPVRIFVYVASQSTRANVDGLRWFMSEVWPVIKGRLPDAGIEVIGKWLPDMQATIPNYEQIRFTGFVPELARSLEERIMIVPLWVGSGIRTKILAAWGASCPVVSTSIGAEGLPGKAGEHFVLADDAASFAEACIGLSGDTARLNRIAANGLELVKIHYSLESVGKRRLEVYEGLLARLGHGARAPMQTAPGGVGP